MKLAQTGLCREPFQIEFIVEVLLDPIGDLLQLESRQRGTATHGLRRDLGVIPGKVCGDPGCSARGRAPRFRLPRRFLAATPSRMRNGGARRSPLRKPAISWNE